MCLFPLGSRGPGIRFLDDTLLSRCIRGGVGSLYVGLVIKAQLARHGTDMFSSLYVLHDEFHAALFFFRPLLRNWCHDVASPYATCGDAAKWAAAILKSRFFGIQRLAVDVVAIHRTIECLGFCAGLTFAFILAHAACRHRADDIGPANDLWLCTAWVSWVD
ncbi:hypothetical protein Nepgr_022989 [Nepenthes gracilis]|uniref:Uncharacterized protein n=1 Tax=Nepenthes gracilis TaxID=150966 RepID=A0AAD3XXB3_NEPGR|nr:hypothetical protein Nepgr_022989 [Nepenthes gracilis]